MSKWNRQRSKPPFSLKRDKVAMPGQLDAELAHAASRDEPPPTPAPVEEPEREDIQRGQ